MNAAEVRYLLDLAEGSFRRFFIRDNTESSWQRYLRDVPLDVGEAAVDALVMQNRDEIDIGDVMAEIRRVRARRLDHTAIAFQPSDPDLPPAAQRAELLAAISAIAGGADRHAGFLKPLRHGELKAGPQAMWDRAPGRRALAAGTSHRDAYRDAVPRPAIEPANPGRPPQVEAAFADARRQLGKLPDLGAEFIAAAQQKLGEGCDIAESIIEAARLAALAQAREQAHEPPREQAPGQAGRAAAPTPLDEEAGTD